MNIMKCTRPIKNVVFAFLLCSFSVTSIIAQDTLKLSDRVKLLEEYKNEILDKRFDTKSVELSNKIEYELKKAKDDVTDQLWIIKITGGIIALVLAAGVGVLLRQYFVGIKKLADKLLNEKLESHLANNSQYIIEMITSQKTENLVRGNRKILLLSHDQEEQDATLPLLKGMGFKNIECKIVVSDEALPKSDLVLFSNKKETFPETLILALMESTEDDDSLVYYGKRLNIDFQKEYAERVNFANSKYTLYHQIINTLSFKEVFQRTI